MRALLNSFSPRACSIHFHRDSCSFMSSVRVAVAVVALGALAFHRAPPTHRVVLMRFMLARTFLSRVGFGWNNSPGSMYSRSVCTHAVGSPFRSTYYLYLHCIYTDT